MVFADPELNQNALRAHLFGQHFSMSSLTVSKRTFRPFMGITASVKILRCCLRLFSSPSQVTLTVIWTIMTQILTGNFGSLKRPVCGTQSLLALSTSTPVRIRIATMYSGVRPLMTLKYFRCPGLAA